MPKKSVARPGKTKKSKPVASSSEPRKLTMPPYHWYDPRTWKYAPLPDTPRKPLPTAWTILKQSMRQLWANWKLFGGIVLVFGLLNIILVRSLSGAYDISALKNSLDGTTGQLTSSLISLVYVVASSGNSGKQDSAVYQTILILVCSLAFIWALRQVVAGKTVKIRDGFYKGMYPLIPFMLVFGLMGAQLLPLAIGGGLYATVVSGGIAVHLWEKAIFLTLFVALGLWSLRMITATIFALYIVTLPDMTPLRAYRSARELVHYRRLLIWRKLIFLPIILLVAAVVIELPLILFITPLAVWSFFVFSMCMLPVIHGYLYNVYRELL